jgi:hypothetical protein
MMKNHSYFVGIFIAVRDALRPRMSVTAAAAAAASSAETKKPSSRDSKDAFINRFANLSVQESSPDFVESFVSAAPVPKQVSTDQTVYEAEQAPFIEEALELFIILCMDLGEIRTCITSIWENHHDASVDLAFIAVATNVTVSLARNMMDDFAPIISRFEGGASSMAQKTFSVLCLTNGFSMGDIERYSQASYTNGTYELANATYLIPASLLSSAALVLKPNAIPL